jgi:hypothetical protein
LQVQTQGLGTLSPNASNAVLNIGQSYSMTATPAAGFVFNNWTGGTSLPLGVLTNGATVQFTMASNLTLSANFVDVQPVTIGGFTWVDINSNGVQDADEPALPGVPVALYQTNTTLATITEVTNTITDASGFYTFTNIPSGAYEVSFAIPSGNFIRSPQLAGSDTNVNSDPNQTNGLTFFFSMTPGETNLSLNAGFVPMASLVPGVTLTSIVISGGNVVLTWTGGQPPYVVEESASLGSGAVWQTVGGSEVGTQMVVPMTNQAGFFRVGN